MVTAEDMAVVQARLIELSDENLELQAGLDAEQRSSLQVPLLRKCIADVERSMIAESHAFEKEQATLCSQIAAQLKRTSSQSRTEISAFEALQAKLSDNTDRLSSLIEIEENLIDHLSRIAIDEDDLGSHRDALKIFIAKFQVIEPQVQSCLGLAMQVEDLIGKFAYHNAIRVAQKGRRKRLINWFTETQAVNAHQREVLAARFEVFLIQSGKAVQKEAELSEVDRVLNGLQTELAGRSIDINTEEAEQERIRANIREIIEQAKLDLQREEQQIDQIDQQSRFLAQDIATYHISEKKLVEKKFRMVQQLSQRLEIERKALERAEMAPNVVDQLTERMSAEMFEKQDLAENVFKHETKLQWLRAEIERKTNIVTELRQMTILTSDGVRTEGELMTDIDNLLSDIQAQNEVHFENLQIAGFEAEGLEAERSSLRGILQEFDQWRNAT
jgi:hypothetical protein